MIKNFAWGYNFLVFFCCLGAILENGSIIAKLILDDPAQVCQVEEYQGTGFDFLALTEEKSALHLQQNYIIAKQVLENSLGMN